MSRRFGDWVRCGECGEEVEGCAGRFGDWMHTVTRREFGSDGHPARPETSDEVSRRLWARKVSA